MANITLAEGEFGWDYLIEHEDGRSILVQTDREYPGWARTFGWDGEDDDLAGAQKFLDDNIGKTVEDPGCFDGDEGESEEE